MCNSHENHINTFSRPWSSFHNVGLVLLSYFIFNIYFIPYAVLFYKLLLLTSFRIPSSDLNTFLEVMYLFSIPSHYPLSNLCLRVKKISKISSMTVLIYIFACNIQVGNTYIYYYVHMDIPSIPFIEGFEAIGT